MSKITQKQLIESLKQMKEIKPRQEWVSLLKSQILSEKQITIQPAKFASWNFIRNWKLEIGNSRRLAYSFAATLLLIAGAFGLVKLLPANQVKTQTASLTQTQQTPLKQNVVAFNSNINSLAQITKEGKTTSIPSAINKVNTNASQLIKNLKDNLAQAQDPQTLKELASSLKTLADVPGTDLTKNADVQNLYQTVVQTQIADLQKTTLTVDNQATLKQAQDLYSQGKYEQALEQILLINNQ